ncbi:hypothetical protein F9C07_4129 [Aspergillus flavus]|uniref:Uncharacterized protein n=1 Tax=Aspergillus flavus (strain ATCC 200026 / FGSC A1120 / IAM 13836 / NRRL 3357 / JCM 12722 / SRRC 167) TaxID=332952 RepID=A0A7U2QZF8_ASPFN|nr:hypothetical protein F9C07_4129 [Aspergillus flavus]
MKKQEGREGKLKVQMKTEDDGRNEQQGGTRDIYSLYWGFHINMKSLPTLFLGCLSLSLASPIVVTYPIDTPPSVLEDAMESIISAGGRITHRFREYP